jgi:diaminohydroxyphosphoribosylaminopyrimidine deaminase/5-amino-6-(5-phosphoribosylamino)uracil reductase
MEKILGENWKEQAMRRCLKLAKKGKNFVKSNPMVGAVLLSKEGNILCEGYHKGFGLRHAEVEALEQIKQAPASSCLFINLEPCCHQGKNPPCAEMIVQKKITRVIIGTLDPNPKVSGGGVASLKKNKIEVEIGICQRECELLNQKYLTHVRSKRAFVALKIAASLDGKIALKNGDSQWITSEKARSKVHCLRSEFEAIGVGKNTFLHDNPKLNNRAGSNLPQPSPVVFWSEPVLREKNLFNYSFFKDTREKFFIMGKNVSEEKLQMIQKKNIGCFRSTNNQPQPLEALRFLYEKKIFSILIEGGGALHTSFLKAGLVDKIYLFLAPKIIGASGKNWCKDLEQLDILSKNYWEIGKTTKLGEDILLEIYPKKNK